MSNFTITESTRIANAYDEILKKGYKNVACSTDISTKKCDIAKVCENSNKSDDNLECTTTVKISDFDPADGKQTVDSIYNSSIDDDLWENLESFYNDNRNEIETEWDNFEELYNEVKDIIRECKPRHHIELVVTKNLSIIVSKGRCVKRSKMSISEGMGDMTDEQYEEWWNSLSDEQKKKELAKIPKNVQDEIMRDDGIDSEDDVNAEDDENGDEDVSDEQSEEDVEADAIANGAASGLMTAGALASGNALEKKLGAKAGAKAGAKISAKAATKAAGKAVGKSLLKKIPIVGALAGLGMGIGRLWGRDANGNLNITNGKSWAKAGGELASGLASTVPGIGTAASAGIDGLMAYDDYKEEMKNAQNAEEQQTNEMSDDSIENSDSEYPIPQDDLFNKKTYASARNYINKKIYPMTTGFFSDDNWSNIHSIFNAISDMGVNLNWGTRNDGTYQHGYHRNSDGVPDSKAYMFDLKYTNIIGKKIKLSGQVIASGAGNVEDPLSRYDIVFQIF